MNVIIRQATPFDAASIVEINSKTWFDTYQSDEYGITKELLNQLPKNDNHDVYIEKKRKDILDNPESYFIACDGDTVVWYANGKIHTDKSYNELFAIYVLSEYQGQWIGGQLSKSVFEYLWDDKDIIVEVIGYNQKAIHFYEKLWFVFHKDLESFEILPGIFVPEIQMIQPAKDSITKARQTLLLGAKTERPDCIVLMGLPGSGKSHVSRYLHDRYGYTILSGENITHALFGGTRCETEQYKNAYATLYTLARQLLEEWYKIVIDGTNLQYAHRKQAYESIGSDIPTFCIHLVTDDTTAQERIARRWENSDDPTNVLSSCSDATFQAFKTSIDLPREDEVVFTVRSDENVFNSIDALMLEILNNESCQV